MEYTIYKDEKVNKTRTRIKKILKSIKAEIEEEIYTYPKKKNKPSSLTLMLYGRKQVSNGKGTTLANAKASAYSEFMERLQNNCMSFLTYKSDKFVLAPDEKPYIPHEQMNFYDYYDKKYIDYAMKVLSDTNRLYSVPFYNVKKKKTCYVPFLMLMLLQETNGMSAGNTPEEALVQGLSEVFERYSKKKIMLGDISLPDIPEEEWGKYDRIVKLKKYLGQYGYDVYFKDASLGQNLPVVCTLFENKKEGFYSINFGAQPSLPIAIERSLTEFMQGGVPPLRLGNGEKLEDIKITEKIDRRFIYEWHTFSTCPLIEKKHVGKTIYEQLFEKPADYEFSKDAWVKESKEYTNKQLLKFLLSNTDLLKDKDIYIRDVSFLKFPAYYIYIPQVSEIFDADIERTKHQYNAEIWKNYQKDFVPEHNSIDSLIYALDFISQKIDYVCKNYVTCQIPNEYLLTMCYIVKNDVDNILKFSEKLLNNKDAKMYHKRAEFIYDYFKLKKEYKKNFHKKLGEIYKEDYVKNMEGFIRDLTFDKIKKRIMISNKNNKQTIDPNKCIYYIPKKDYGNFEERVEELRQRLGKEYLKNTPDQMKLKKVFDFI